MPYKNPEDKKRNIEQQKARDPEGYKQRNAEASRRWRQKHPEKRREMARTYYWAHHKEALQKIRDSHLRHLEARQACRRDYSLRIRKEVIGIYGGHCACCGEQQIEFLCIDHINGGGTQHRKQVGYGAKFYMWLRSQGYPEGYQVLCYNCNMGKESPGGCPHKRDGDPDHTPKHKLTDSDKWEQSGGN